MVRWIVYHCRQPLRFQRSVVISIVLFMITTGFLYSLIEYSTMTTHNLSSYLSSFPSKTIPIKLECQLQNETIRAINSTSSDYCKKQLKQVSCEIDSIPNFFPQTLPRFCPIQKGNFGDIVGCILHDDKFRNSANQVKYLDIDTACIDNCLKYSLSFAAYNDLTRECFCMSQFDSEKQLTSPNKKCNETKFDDDHKKNNSMTIYRTGHIDFGNHLDRRDSIKNAKHVTIVFFLTVGGRKNFRQIKRLIRAIYSRQHYYLIHIDSREDYLYEQLLHFSANISNIHLTNKRYPTTWGSSTLLTAHLEAFKQIFEELKWNFSFILNLSETDFPLKPIPVLTNFLSMYTSFNFLRSHNRDPFNFILSQGMYHTFIHCENYMYRIGSRQLIQNIIYDGGSDWYVLNREFVHYATYGDDVLANGLRHIFNYSLLPCEAYFHTLLSNSIYCDTIIRNNLRLVHWNRQRGCKCQHKHVVDWCGCSPVVFKYSDKNLLNETFDKPLFFARKFDPTIDENIIDWLDGKISRKDLSKGAFYLQNIYHSIDGVLNIKHPLNLFDRYSRASLSIYQKFRRDCLLDDNLHLVQIHSIFNSSVFQGYSLQYKYDDGSEIELFLRLRLTESVRSDYVKRFEIGLQLDSKEYVFVDYCRTFIEPKVVKVLIEWNSMTDNDTTLIIYNPNNVIVQQAKLISSLEPVIIDVLFPATSSMMINGIWQMSIIKENHQNSLGSLNFLILLANNEQILKNQYYNIMTNFWSLESVCSPSTVNHSSCSHLSNKTEMFFVQNCFDQQWSYFFYDIKSDL